MTLALNKDARKDAIASIERYFQENMDEPIGNIAAGALLGFFLEEIGFDLQPGGRGCPGAAAGPGDGTRHRDPRGRVPVLAQVRP